jgi:hypothetical protein
MMRAHSRALALSVIPGKIRRSSTAADSSPPRSGDYEEVMNKASCLSLLSNAVLVWNTVHIGRIVDQLRAAGHEVKDEDLARVSPLAHAHVIPNGSYFQSPRRRAEMAPNPSPPEIPSTNLLLPAGRRQPTSLISLHLQSIRAAHRVLR